MDDGGGNGNTPTLDTLSVLFTDLVGSTELRTRLGEDAAEVVRRSHDGLIAAVVEGHGGRMVKGLGDGFLATFGSAARAVAAAVAIQQGFEMHLPGEPNIALSVRIGISLGDVSVESGDVFGTPVIEAARLCAAAEGGQILAASVVETLARRRGEQTFVALGELDLKGLPEPLPTVEIVWERKHDDRGGMPFPVALSVREGAFPFRGRDDVIDQLTVTCKRTFHGSTKACVLIAGEPGMGKTRLASEFAQRQHDVGAIVLFGRCDEELGVPYQPFVEALGHHVRHLAEGEGAALGTRPSDLARLAPEVHDRFPEIGELASSGDAEVDQYRLFEAVDAWLEAASQGSGLVLVLDDVHWADRPTLLLLRHVLRSGTPSKLMIVATYRDTDLDRTHPLSDLLADLRRVPEVERIALEGLDRTGVEELIEAAAQHSLDDDARTLASAVHAETEGNPFFIGELLRHLAETGALVQEGGRWSAATSVEEMSLPDGIREVIGRRLSRLSETTNDVLAWAAVLGRDLQLDVLARVAGGEDRCLDALDEAVDARLVDEAGAGRWRFAHALVRSTLLAELRTTRRVRMHLAVGEAYEAVAPDDVAALAQHFAEAAPLAAGEKAVAYLLAAGGLALETLAFDQAEALHRRALEIIDDVGLDAPELRADAAYGVAVARRWTGDNYDAAIAEACQLAEALGDGNRMARVLLDTNRGFSRRVFEVDSVFVGQLERALELLPPGDSRARVLVTAALVGELQYSNDRDRVLALSDEAVDIARRTGDRDALIAALSTRFGVFNLPDRLALAAPILAELEPMVTDAVTVRVRAGYAGAIVALAGWSGDRAQFHTGIARFAAIADSLPPSSRWLSAAARAGYELRFGDLATAAALSEDLLRQAGETGEPDALLWYANLMGFTYRQQGRSDEAVALFAPLVAEPNPATEAAGPLLALILCEGERHDEAREIVDRFMASGRSYERDTSLLPNIGTLAVVAAELQDRDASVWLLEVLEPFDAWWSAWGAYGPIAPVSTLVARLRVTLGDYDGAESSFADAIVHCRANESRYFLAEVLLQQGLARSARGVESHDRADESLREALELARTGGFHGIARRADRALAR